MPRWPPGREFAGQIQKIAMGSRDPGRQRAKVGGGAERLQAGLPAGQQPGKLGRRHAILAGAGKHGFHATLDFRQALGIEVDPIGITAQGRYRFRQFCRSRLQQAGNLLQRRVVARQ